MVGTGAGYGVAWGLHGGCVREGAGGPPWVARAKYLLDGRVSHSLRTLLGANYGGIRWCLKDALWMI